MTLDNLSDALTEIGWSIKGKYPNSWIFDRENKRTNIYVKNDGLEVEHVFEDRHSGTIYFGFNGAKLTVNEGMVTVGTDECFVSFYNHDK